MTVLRVLITLAFALILGIPFALRPAQERRHDRANTPTLVIVTPHVQQIQREFSAGFDRWHERVYHQHAVIDWRTPGGTSEIVTTLQSQYNAAIKNGHLDCSNWRSIRCAAGTIGFDLFFGGGSFDHGRVKAGDKVLALVAPAPEQMGPPYVFNVAMSIPVGFTQQQLDDWFGPNKIGAQTLYDPDQHWIGVALSGFGIVYNRDILTRLGLPEPRAFEDLADPRYAGWVALADPRQSGSIATSFDSILSNASWDQGWRLLREMSANTRYFTNSSTKPPIDISAGEAAAGLAIDFYGRGQAQSVMEPGQTPATSRIGYIDPAGAVYIDADPISILRGGPNPELAKRFIEFCLSDEGQALWQFHAPSSPAGANNPAAEDGRPMGPVQYELRRAPARRVMYEKYLHYFVDQSNPFTLASETTPKGWRSSIGIMMGAFGIDTADQQRAAWSAINRARSNPSFPRDKLAQMELLFYAWPQTIIDGKPVDFTPDTCKAIIASWRKPGAMPDAKIAYVRFFLDNYRRIIQLGEGR